MADFSWFTLWWLSDEFAQAFAGLKVTFLFSVHVKIFYNPFFHFFPLCSRKSFLKKIYQNLGKFSEIQPKNEQLYLHDCCFSEGHPCSVAAS